MNSTFHRLTAPVFARIPDISGVPPRRRVAIGVVASLLFHSLLILVIVILGAIAPQRVEFAKSKLKQREIELTILPPPPDETVLPFTLAQTPDQPFLDSRGLQIARDAALNAIFQSDENMQAASELPATGDIPLPSQGGRDRPFNAFQSQKSLLGAATDLFPTAPDTPPPQPQVSPAPNDPKMAQDSVPAPPAPAATPPPKSVEKEIAAATPPPLKTVTKPKDDEIAVATKAAATPPPVSKILSSTPPPKIRPVEQQAMLTTPVPRSKTAAKSGYQPEQEENRIEGSISNRGKKSVDAVATPLAKYRKQVNDAIGSRWYYYIKPRMDLIAAGSVRISFAIDEQGHISAIKIDSNTSNKSFADVCERAVREAEIQPPPADAVIPLKDGRLECSLTFTFYNL